MCFIIIRIEIEIENTSNGTQSQFVHNLTSKDLK